MRVRSGCRQWPSSPSRWRSTFYRKKDSRIVASLDELLRDSTAGDPMGGLRWTHKTSRNLANELTCKGIKVGHVTVLRLLRLRKYSPRTNRKSKAKIQNPDRDRQFKLLAKRRRKCVRDGVPIISIDTKKKELIGNFKNAGVTWRKAAREVFDHDFPSWADGRAVPFGIYDIARNKGFVSVGISSETADFATHAIYTWWLKVARHHYADANRLVIEADCGGANNPRTWLWRTRLQRLADKLGLTITVGHFPPGASKWNLIEHRMFNLISANWAGEPLISYETVLKYLRSTRSSTGFTCRAILDQKLYATKQEVSSDEKASITLRRHTVLPDWNYTVYPRDL